MPDNRLGIGVDISATGADTFKKQVDESVKALDGLRKVSVTMPKVDLSKVVTGAPALQKQVDAAEASLSGISKAFVQLPTVDVSRVVTGVPELKNNVQDLTNTDRKSVV